MGGRCAVVILARLVHCFCFVRHRSVQFVDGALGEVTLLRHGDGNDDDKEYHRHSGGSSDEVPTSESGLVDARGDEIRGAAGVTRFAASQAIHEVKSLEGGDKGGDENEESGRPQKWQVHLGDEPHRPGAVKLRGLDNGLGDSLKPGEEEP